MAEPTTQRNDASVDEFLAGVEDPDRRGEAQALCALVTEATGAQPRMWGTAIVGFGVYTYRYASGREGEWPAVGLSPRKRNLTVYLAEGFTAYTGLLDRLGPHTLGKGCLYLRRLSDVDEATLRELVTAAFTHQNGRIVTT